VMTLSALPAGGRGGADLSHGLVGLWCDVDTADGVHESATPLPDRFKARRFLEMLAKPTLVINSGGGYHAYWMLERPVYAAGGFDCASALNRWNAGLQGA